VTSAVSWKGSWGERGRFFTPGCSRDLGVLELLPLGAPSRLNCWIANTLRVTRFPWDRWRPAGILKILGRRPGLLAGGPQLSAFRQFIRTSRRGRQRTQGKRALPILG
jgi:hypothetical protein